MLHNTTVENLYDASLIIDRDIAYTHTLQMKFDNERAIEDNPNDYGYGAVTSLIFSSHLFPKDIREQLRSDDLFIEHLTAELFVHCNLMPNPGNSWRFLSVCWVNRGSSGYDLKVSYSNELPEPDEEEEKKYSLKTIIAWVLLTTGINVAINAHLIW